MCELGSIKAVAQRFAITDSAVSHAIKRMRDAFGEPCFVLAKGRLIPTRRCISIYKRLSPILPKMDQLAS